MEMLACNPAGTVNRQAEPQSPAPEQFEGSTDDLDTKFNLSQFSPPAARRLSTGCVRIFDDAGYHLRMLWTGCHALCATTQLTNTWAPKPSLRS